MGKLIEIPDDTARKLAEHSEAAGVSESELLARWAEERIEADRRRAEKIANMQRLITEGLESGRGTMSMADIRREAMARMGLAPDS